MSLQIGTEADHSYLSLAAAARAGLQPGGPGVVVESVIEETGQAIAWSGPMAELAIGDEEIRSSRIRFDDMAKPAADLVLGRDFLLSHRVLVSNSQHRIYLSYEGGPVFLPGEPAPTP